MFKKYIQWQKKLKLAHSNTLRRQVMMNDLVFNF